jgi:hypothetical protein
MVTALTCPNCTAPLPTPAGTGFVVCGYCGATAQLGQAGAPTATRARAPEAPSPYPNSDDRAAFGSAFGACMIDGRPFVPALEEAARSALAAYGDQRAMVYTVAHLVTDFERETGATVHDDPLVIVRVVQAYYQVVHEVADTRPIHLSRTLSAEDLARMGSSPPPSAPSPPPAPNAPSAPTPEPKKKKGWFW